MKTRAPATPATTHFPPGLPRRDFLRRVLAAGTVSIFTPRLLLAQGKTKATPKKFTGEKVRLACAGIGGRGNDVIKQMNDTGIASIVALCDTDMGAPHTLGTLKRFPNAPRFQDFRKMLDKMAGDIDAVCICTPDVSHFAIAMHAMALGKHVYVEKPMAHTFRQIEVMMAAEKKYKVITQMGNQGHSEANYFQFKAWVDAGVIKNVRKITAYMNLLSRWHGNAKLRFPNVTGFLPAEPIPDTLDWDCWLATALEHDYNKGYMDGTWRAWYDFGNGTLGDYAPHIFDTAHEFLNLGLPVEVEAVKLDGYNKFIFPQASTLAFRFPARGAMPPLTLTWYDGANNRPPFPPELPETANDGEPVRLSAGKFIYGEGLTFMGNSHGAILRVLPAEKARAMASTLPPIPKSPSNHYANFLLACKGVEKTRSPFSVAGPLCEVMALGVIAQRLNAKFAFDRDTKQVTDNKIANELLKGVPPRKGWEQYYVL